MAKLQELHADALSEALATPGITRHLAFEGGGCRVLCARSDSGKTSGWHHHGDHDVYGDIVHREINPSSEEGNEMILFLRGSGQLVF